VLDAARQTLDDVQRVGISGRPAGLLRREHDERALLHCAVPRAYHRRSGRITLGAPIEIEVVAANRHD
jgi:hypothetical protein